MRIERLSFQAFGPYVKRQDIDFSLLSSHHLFLMRGATGAGKTAILDAITYALYGKSSGGERGDFESMRSRLAPPELPTFIELIISLRHQRYRFYREINVGKKRNGDLVYKVSVNGGTYQQDVFEPFFENCKQTLLEKKAEELIGLSHAQFIQVMVLPQGKFERLLVSKSEEKQEILKTLFQTQRWSTLCVALGEQLRQKKDALDQLTQTMTVWLKQAQVTSNEALVEQIQQQESAYRKDQALLLEQQKAMEHAQRIYEEQLQLHQQLQKLRQLQTQLQTTLQQQPSMEVLRKRMEQLAELRRLQPFHQAYKEASQRLQEVEARRQVCERTLQQSCAKLQKYQSQEEQMKQRQAWLEQAEKQQVQYQQKLEVYQAYHNANVRLKQAQTKRLQIEEIQAKAQAQETRIQEKQQGYQQRLSYLEQQSMQYAKLLEHAQRGDAWRRSMQEHQANLAQQASWEKEIQAKKQRLREIMQKEEQANQRHEKMYQAYLSNSATLLASLIQEGEECPVCGATHHPHLATAQHQMVELQTLNQQKAEVDRWSKEHQQASAWLVQAEKRQQELQEEGRKQQEALVMYQADNWTLEAVAKAIAAVKHGKEELTQLAKIREEGAVYQQQLETIKTKKEMIAQQHQQLLLDIATLQAQITAQFPEMDGLDGTALTAQYSSLNQKIQMQKQAVEAWKLGIHEAEMEQARQASAFSHLETEHMHAKQACLQASTTLKEENHQQISLDQPLLQEPEAEKAQQQLDAFERTITQLQANIQALTEQTKQSLPQDMNQVEQDRKEKEMAYRTLLQQVLKEESAWKQSCKLHDQITALSLEYEQAMLAYGKHNEFVRAMRGDTSIGIERYVLGIMLSSITQVANERLRKVHDGRYQIYRSDAASGRTRKFGLELSIYDAYSCSMRSVVSLSGGEKFLVSLALSLALSTVVQARSGGVVMEAMFIDEGFGSLDEQSIADALQILSSMANTKAMIGIISHVELLKENIPYGINVKKDKDGSSCTLLV